MKTENWKQIKELLQEVLSLEKQDRKKFLDDARISNEIRREVESLLAFEEESEDLMRLSAVEFSKDFFEKEEEPKNTLIGQRFGVYEIARELGYGGMGAVFLATRSDGKFKQKVALKLLKREMNTSALRRHFRKEREILASLEHPNIARLLDAGTTDDKIPFIAMEYVEGLPIDEYCSKNNVDLTERLQLFCKICASVGFAHRNLIVHRDLKPSNILVTEDGTPKLLDFGISKILSTEIENVNSATITRLGAMTPSYASPEQLRSESVTTATDIYSLGVILYELLSGHRPFETVEHDLKEIYKAVIETDPLPPSALIAATSHTLREITEAKTLIQESEISAPAATVQKIQNQTAPNKMRHTISPAIKLNSGSLRGDLDNIVLKALRKEPERRYSSAENFAEDVRRHLAGLPVTARPNTFSYRAEKFVKRHRAGVFAGMIIFLAIVGGVVATLWQAQVARAEHAKAEKRFNDVRALANSFLFEFSPKIENLPGSTPARQLLVTRALEYLDNLSQEASGDVELQSELAKAYEKVGDVQGNPYNPNIGDVKGALGSYEKAQAIRAKLLELDPDSLEAQSGLANNYEIYGDIHSNGGDYAKAKIFLEKAVALREKIVGQNPNDYEARVKLASAVKSHGLIPFYEGDNKAALIHFNRAKDLYEQLHREKPEDEKVATQYFYSFVTMGEAYGWDNQPAVSEENIQKGLRLLIPLGEKHPNNQSVQRLLMLANLKAGENYEDLKQFDKSIAAYNNGLEIAEFLHRADPQSAQAKRDLAMANKKLAQALDSGGKSRESIEKLQTALKIFEDIAAADPHNTEAPYDVANTRFSIGETLLSLKDYETALDIFLQAKTGFEKVLQINPENNYATRMSTFNLNRIGKSYAALADKRNRQEFLNRSLENHRAALNNLNKMKAAGKLGEVDFEAIGEIEGEIKVIESKFGKI